MLPGVSTLGVKFGYGLETTAGKKPAAFTKLDRINAIGGISLSTEQIDASALEDLVSKYVAGRQDTGGTFPVTVNYTSETATQWETAISAYNARANEDLRMWWEVYHPDLAKAFFIVAEPPKKIPMPEIGQNSLLTVEMSLTINEYVGAETAIEPGE